jgi:hypothetical protein
MCCPVLTTATGETAATEIATVTATFLATVPGAAVSLTTEIVSSLPTGIASVFRMKYQFQQKYIWLRY